MALAWRCFTKSQKQIVNILRKNDQIIEKYDKLIKEKEQFIKSQFVEMFGNEGKTISLNEISNKITDGSHNPPKGESEDTGYYMLSSQNIDNGILDYKNSRYLKKDDFENENKRTMLKNGDILFSIVGTIGKVAIFEDDKNVTFQRSVAIIKSKEDISKYFLIYSLLSNEVKKQIYVMSKGGAQEGIYLEDLKRLKIKNVDVKKQNTFERIVKLIDKQKFICRKSIKYLKKLLYFNYIRRIER